MNAEHIAHFIDAGVNLAGGLWGTLVGYRVVGDRMLTNGRYAKLLVRMLPALKIAGPIMLLSGVYLTTKAFNTSPV